MLADYMVALEAVQGAQNIINRIKSAEEHEGAAAELEVGGMLARNGYTLTIGPQFGDKRPDFLCEQNGAKFLAEVKTLENVRGNQGGKKNLGTDSTGQNNPLILTKNTARH